MKDIDKLRDIYIAQANELDEDERADNERKIEEWEQGLIHNEALLSWKEHDITKKIAAQAKETYRELGLQLAANRSLTDEQRKSMWAKQDAMAWILSLTENDPKAEIEHIHSQIKAALDTTNGA